MTARKRISPFSTVLVFVCISILGLTWIPLLPIKVAPTQTLPHISVGYSMHRGSPRIIELEVTSKLEAMLNRMSGVQQITSTSGNGWGRINLSFNKHTDMDIARFEISTIVRQLWTALPQNVSYPSITQSYADQNAAKAFLTFTINAPVSPQEIQRYAENYISPSLSMIEGIDKVEVSGATPMIWRINYDAELMQQQGVEVHDIQTALGNALQERHLDRIFAEDDKGQYAWVRAVLPAEKFNDKDLISEILVKNIEGTLIPLSKVAKISYVEAEPQSYYRVNGLNSIYLNLSADESNNQMELQKNVMEQLADIKISLPLGYEIHTSYDATEYIKEELDKVYFRSGTTLAILILFILISYRNWKYTTLILISLCCNLAIAVILYYLLRLEIQLYSLVGITISLTLILDNIIVMADHIVYKGNKKSFMAILAATLTTIGSLSVIFFLDEKLKMSLQDFAAVIMVNLTVSLFVALFLVPALIDRLKISPKNKVSGKRKNKRRLYRLFARPYAAVCKFIYRWKVIVAMLIILAFGIPIFLIPEKIEGDSKWAQMYNKSFGSEYYKEYLQPSVNKVLGGSLRLFVQDVYTGSYFGNKEETTLSVNASLPNHSTLAEMNGLIQRMESYLSQFKEIKQFQTQIYNARRANIHIQFTKEHAKGGFPHVLKSNLISKSLEMGGGSWSVYGVGDGFSNDVRESAGSYRVEMYGFNYDELYNQATLFKNRLLENRRIKEVNISAEFSWFKDSYEEYVFELKKQKLAEENIEPYQLFNTLNRLLAKDMGAGTIIGLDGPEAIYIDAQQADAYDIWHLLHSPIHANNKVYKLDELADIKKDMRPQEVAKINQQYRLCLQYEYIGAAEQGKKVLEKQVEEFEPLLPIGYSMKNLNMGYSWGQVGNKQYMLLALIFIIIYFIAAILFNSIKQPLYILFVIPISFIGIFMSFYLFKINFDQGGFASFILLSGLTINANIYVINEYNNIKKKWPKLPAMRAYMQAWNAKVKPIFLTVFSTILGFTPFLLGDNKEGFWFPLAVGTIGGLVIATLATFLFLPLFMGVGRRRK